jgi:hypothetical protein
MAQDHYIYIVLAICRDEPTSEGGRFCKAYPVDLCGVRETVEEAEACAQAENTDDNDIPIPLEPWPKGFWDGRKETRGIHDNFVIIRTYNHPFP